MFVVLAMFVSFSLAQQTYKFEAESSTTVISIPGDEILVGQSVISISDYVPGTETGENSLPTHLVEYTFSGIDANGTLHMLRSDNFYITETEFRDESAVVFDLSDMPLTIAGTLIAMPDLIVNIDRLPGGKIKATIINTEEFQPME
jgi:hypothetical protein